MDKYKLINGTLSALEINESKYEYYGTIEKDVKEIIKLCKKVIFPVIFIEKQHKDVNREIKESLDKLYNLLKDVIQYTDSDVDFDSLITNLFNSFSVIRQELKADSEFAFLSDPAAHSCKEILLSYPSFRALILYRISHVLYKNNAFVLSRIIMEEVHRITGIDIHPGANIDSPFFIDHGTGVVIGETTNIGKRVKIYQGVTLGAKSFPLDENGNPIKGIKRHPDIEDDVVIYANATILGGNTVIKKGSVIGANAWITETVDENSVVGHHKEEK